MKKADVEDFKELMAEQDHLRVIKNLKDLPLKGNCFKVMLKAVVA